jgi:glycosyltransferase involved in cell wall biosynthesis
LRVSIVIPLYNKAPWIGRALDSVRRQSFDDFELFLVDDGSTDSGADVLSDFIDPRFHLIKQPNAGPGAARNLGISKARGEFVAFLDADDEWLPDYLETSIHLLDELGKDVSSISSGYVDFPLGGSLESFWRARGVKDGLFRLSPDTPPLEAVHRLAYMSPCSTVARTAIVRRWGGFYSRDRCLYAEDAHLWLKFLLNEPLGFQLRPLVRFHRDASGLSLNLNGPRPIEPFLLDSSEIEAACPDRLRRLLSQLLAIRAYKTACMLGCWGDWTAARAIVARFSPPGAWKLPYFLPAKISSTTLGAIAGYVLRNSKRIYRSN